MWVLLTLNNTSLISDRFLLAWEQGLSCFGWRLFIRPA